MVDEWHFRVTLTDGRAVICGGMTEVSRPGFVYLRPVQDGGKSPDDYWFDGPNNKNAYVLQDRGMDVSWACISSVEWGIS